MKEDIPASPSGLVVWLSRWLNTESGKVNAFLQAENRVLHEHLGVKRLRFTDRQRRTLVRHGMPIKARLAEVITIVKPETLLAWNRRLKQRKWDYSKRRNPTGRPPVPADTESLVVRMAEDNPWGYTRIAGELRKLGHNLCPSTIANLLRKHGLPASPHRKGLSWKAFIQSHLDVSWACDFFTEEVWTKAGLMTFYVLFFIHLKTRQVRVAGCTPNPDGRWMSQQARNFSMERAEQPGQRRFIIHDRDNSFLPMDAVLETEGLEIVKTPPHSPWCNGYAERFVREARETLNSLILFGEGHLWRVMRQIEEHHNRARPHQGLNNAIPLGYHYPVGPAPPDRITCESRLGGLLNDYSAAPRAA